MFSAIVIDKTDAGQTVSLTQVDEAQLSEGDVTIDVQYSTLNYKDGLAITGSSPVVRKFPMTPGSIWSERFATAAMLTGRPATRSS
jgi:acrylyl-CoA reductase (NADPH)